MIAFALSGGANRGALEVGALRAFYERGIEPKLVCGTSAGALNAAWFALRPDNIVGLIKLWVDARLENVWPGNPLVWAWHVLIGRTGFVSYKPLMQYAEQKLVEEYGRSDFRFDELMIPLRVTTVDLLTRSLVVFGKEGSDFILPPVIASAAMPVISEPVPIGNYLLVDGGAAMPLPLEPAIVAGATEIYAVDLTDNYPTLAPPNNIFETAYRDFQCVLKELVANNIRDAMRANITLHHIVLQGIPGMSLLDFEHAPELIRMGHEQTIAYLDSPHPLRRHHET